MGYFNIVMNSCIVLHHKRIVVTIFFAEVVELVDTLDLGSSAARREGSSPFFGTSL